MGSSQTEEWLERCAKRWRRRKWQRKIRVARRKRREAELRHLVGTMVDVGAFKVYKKMKFDESSAHQTSTDSWKNMLEKRIESSRAFTWRRDVCSNGKKGCVIS
jgi:hypothetical protein